MELVGINIRSWLYSGESCLEDMVLGVEEKAVRDGANHLSTDEFDSCIGIVVCQLGMNTFAHLAQVVGYYRGEASKCGIAVAAADLPRAKSMKSKC